MVTNLRWFVFSGLSLLRSFMNFCWNRIKTYKNKKFNTYNRSKLGRLVNVFASNDEILLYCKYLQWKWKVNMTAITSLIKVHHSTQQHWSIFNRIDWILAATFASSHKDRKDFLENSMKLSHCTVLNRHWISGLWTFH